MPSEFRKCVLSGVFGSTAGTGFPDGDPNPAVTLDLRSTYVFTPSVGSKNVAFTVWPHSHGCIVLNEGTLSSTELGFLALTNTVSSGFSLGNVAAGTAAMGAIADSRLNSMTNGFGGQSSGGPMVAFRPVMAIVDSMYTGASQYDSGSVTVTTNGYVPVTKSDYELAHSTTLKSDVPLVDTFNFTYNASRTRSSMTLPARNEFAARLLAGDTEYTDIEPRMYTNSAGAATQYGFLTTVGTTGPMPGPAYAKNTPAKSIVYSGLDSTASITVTVRYCVQFKLGNTGSWLPFANPSPPPVPADLSWYKTLASKLPTIEQMAGAARVARWALGTNQAPGRLGDL